MKFFYKIIGFLPPGIINDHHLPEQTAKFAPIWLSFLKLHVIFIHQTLTEHGLCTGICHNWVQNDTSSSASNFNWRNAF